MENGQGKSNEQFWKKEIKKHWKALALCIAVIIILIIIAVNVLIWQIQTSPIGNYGTATFDQWSLDWIVRFVIVLILWELLFVGIPAVLMFGLGGYLWWQRLDDEEKSIIKTQDGNNHRKRNAGGSCGLLFFIAYCIYIAIDGNYFTAFGSLPYSYWIYAYLLTLGWLLIIFGIPLAVIGLLYLRYWLNKP